MKIFKDQQAQITYLSSPETEFTEYLLEIEQLINFESLILEKIESDLNKHAKIKKHTRILDQEWNRREQLDIFPSEKKESPSHETLSLEVGRPRMSAFVVFVFLMLRGYLTGFKSRSTQIFLSESQSIAYFLSSHGLKMPGMSTIIENVNAISSSSYSFIFDAQIKMIMNEKLDDFRSLTIDSTSVKSNTVWPTDSTVIRDLVKRIYHRGSHLEYFGMNNIQARNFEYLIKKINSRTVSIAFETGKKDSEKKRKKYYKELLSLAQKSYEKFVKELKLVDEEVKPLQLLPSKQAQLLRIIEGMHEDVSSLEQVIAYCKKRVFENKTTKSTEKIMSLSDSAAAYIQKGGREAVIGYKPQLGRSCNGFISSILTPQGNASDSGQLDAMIQDHYVRTKVMPHEISVDDGYANSTVREKYIKKGVKIFSISGSKGKRMTPEEDYFSEEYQISRNDRSSVESLMFTIKHNFNFAKVMRRGIEAVRNELLEKVLAYNCCRRMQIQKKQVNIKKVA